MLFSMRQADVSVNFRSHRTNCCNEPRDLMNEVRALVEAFDEAVAAEERCALATIVSVEGSSYRRPGARMLISESGNTTGTISAGCLENDVIEHSKRVIQSGEAKL